MGIYLDTWSTKRMYFPSVFVTFFTSLKVSILIYTIKKFSYFIHQRNFYCLIIIACIYVSSTRTGSTKPGRITEKTSTGLCWPLHYTFPSSSEGRQWASLDLFHSSCQHDHHFHGRSVLVNIEAYFVQVL